MSRPLCLVERLGESVEVGVLDGVSNALRDNSNGQEGPCWLIQNSSILSPMGPAHLPLPLVLGEVHLLEDLGTLLHHQCLFVGVSRDVTLMLWVGGRGQGRRQERKRSSELSTRRRERKGGRVPSPFCHPRPSLAKDLV